MHIDVETEAHSTTTYRASSPAVPKPWTDKRIPMTSTYSPKVFASHTPYCVILTVSHHSQRWDQRVGQGQLRTARAAPPPRCCRSAAPIPPDIHTRSDRTAPKPNNISVTMEVRDDEVVRGQYRPREGPRSVKK